MPADYLFLYALVDSPIFIAHSFQKRWATPEKMTGNVFKKHGQCFSKPSATFFETMGNEKQLFLLQQILVDLLHEILARQGSHGHHWFALFRDKEERRDTLDAKGGRQLFLLIDIDLIDNDLLFVEDGQVSQDGGYLFAGATPVGIEIDDARFAALIDPFIGVLLVVEYFL